MSRRVVTATGEFGAGCPASHLVVVKRRARDLERAVRELNALVLPPEDGTARA
jgi:hypothetical protein